MNLVVSIVVGGALAVGVMLGGVNIAQNDQKPASGDQVQSTYAQR